MSELTLPIAGMTCGHCEASVKTALDRLDGVTVLAVDRTQNHARVNVQAAVTRAQLVDAIEAIGFDVPESD